MRNLRSRRAVPPQRRRCYYRYYSYIHYNGYNGYNGNNGYNGYNGHYQYNNDRSYNSHYSYNPCPNSYSYHSYYGDGAPYLRSGGTVLAEELHELITQYQREPLTPRVHELHPQRADDRQPVDDVPQEVSALHKLKDALVEHVACGVARGWR